jgi:hypothetical protein
MLLIQEPPLTAYNTHVNYSAWHLYQSTCQEDTLKKRSLLYVSRRISTASHQQIKCNHPDVIAVKMWSKNRIYHIMIKHAKDLVSFFHKHRLQSCLSQGTPTYWSISHPGSNSTINLTVMDAPGSLIKYQLYHNHYGSDHRAVYSEWSLDPSWTAEREP